MIIYLFYFILFYFHDGESIINSDPCGVAVNVVVWHSSRTRCSMTCIAMGVVIWHSTHIGCSMVCIDQLRKIMTIYLFIYFFMTINPS